MNNTTNTPHTLEEFNDEMRTKLMAPLVYLALLSLIGIPGNIFVIIIFSKYRRGVYRSLILTIGVVDLLFCLIGIPFNITRILFYYKFTITWICQAFVGILDYGIMVSTHLLVLLSIHRFRQVCIPLGKQITKDNVKYWILVCFGISLCLSTPQVAVLQPLERADLKDNVTGLICAVSWKGAPYYWTVYNYCLTGLFLIYAFVLVVIYSLIGRKIIISHIERKTKAVNSIAQSSSNKMTKIAFTVCVVFALSYLPLFTNELLTKELDQSTLSTVEFGWYKIYERSYMMNHVVNPFIYTVLDKHYRTRLKNLLCAIVGQQSSETSESRESKETGARLGRVTNIYQISSSL